MPTEKKLFIATSSFGKDKPLLFNILKKKKVNFALNKLSRKLTSEELVYYAKNFTHIIAGTEIYDKKTLTKLNKLEVIYRLGVGTDNIDLKYAKKKKVKVFRSKVTLEKAVGELTLGLIINLLRKISKHDHNLKNGFWKKEMGNLLFGKTVGIIGYGKIGKYVAKLLKNFGVKILISDLKKIKNKVSLRKLVTKSDIISIHTNYISNNHHLLNKSYLKLLKNTSLIINTSRPEIIDYHFLYILLKNKKIKGAALDVFYHEPYKGKLTNLNNVLLTPHIGSYASEVRNEMETEAVNFIVKNL